MPVLQPLVRLLPTGAVTFLLTDVEGNTRLWELYPERMREALIRHDALIRRCVDRHAGVLVRPRGEGDSRFAVFLRAVDAAAAAGRRGGRHPERPVSRAVATRHRHTCAHRRAANFENLHLRCFIFGALFTVMSALFGFHGAGLHGIHMGGHPADHSGAGGGGANAPHAGSQTVRMPLMTAPSLLGFPTWFGAAGYVLERCAALALVVVLVGALLAGAVGWYLITRFLMLIPPASAKCIRRTTLEGRSGRLTIGIPEGRTGEFVFSKAGARRIEAARALGGVSIPHGTEVVITSYVNGFATVQTWVEFTRQSGERC